MKKLIILILLAGVVTLLSNENEYIPIPSSSIRMRVIANSNSKKDQDDKKIIKSILEEKLYEVIKDADNPRDIDSVLVENKNSIDAAINSEMVKRGIDMEFSSNFGMNYFPEKEFKGLTYKAGNYKSYVVTLGEGKGDNWWCVLYPPLCLIDETKEEYEYHYLIKDAISKYN